MRAWSVRSAIWQLAAFKIYRFLEILLTSNILPWTAEDPKSILKNLKKWFLKIFIIERAILKRLTILDVLAKSADFELFKDNFSRVNIFINHFLILNLLFRKVNKAILWKKKKFSPPEGTLPFFMKIKTDILLNKSNQNTFLSINSHYIMKGTGWNSTPIEL